MKKGVGYLEKDTCLKFASSFLSFPADSKMSSGNAKIGHPAPNFKATAVMPDGQFKDISLSDYRGKSSYIRFV